MSSETESPHLLYHPFPHGGSEDGCLHVYGSRDANKLVIMCAGFPDDQSVFAPLASRLANDSGCLVGVTCLPGYDETTAAAASKTSVVYTFADAVINIREAVKALRAYSTDKSAKLTGVFHDWGCVPGMTYTNQELAGSDPQLTLDRVVLFDILLVTHPKQLANLKFEAPPVLSELRKIIILLTYQLWFVTSFILHRHVLKALGRLHFRAGLALLPIFGLIPLTQYDLNHGWNVIDRFGMDYIVQACWPYFVFWRSIVTGKLKQIGKISTPLDLKRTPILFMYGADKPTTLHPADTLALLEQEQAQGRGSRVVAFEGASHWLYLQDPDRAYKEIHDFVAKT